MNLAEALARLEQAGSDTIRRIYMNHGAREPLFGVKTSDLKILNKAIKKDHALAQELWDTGNYDARVLATQIADPKQVTEELAERWIHQVDNYGLTDYVVALIAQTPFAEAKARAWMAHESEWIARAGWHLIGALAADAKRPDATFAPLLPVIEQGIHTRPNRTREAMLNALIAIGGRGGTVEAPALEAARRIGTVDIDHGKTGCKTPNAIVYIGKMRERAAKKQPV